MLVDIPYDPAVAACAEVIDALLALQGIEARRGFHGTGWMLRLDRGDGTFRTADAETFQGALVGLGLLVKKP